MAVKGEVGYILPYECGNAVPDSQVSEELPSVK